MFISVWDTLSPTQTAVTEVMFLHKVTVHFFLLYHNFRRSEGGSQCSQCAPTVLISQWQLSKQATWLFLLKQTIQMSVFWLSTSQFIWGFRERNQSLNVLLVSGSESNLTLLEVLVFAYLNSTPGTYNIIFWPQLQPSVLPLVVVIEEAGFELWKVWRTVEL